MPGNLTFTARKSAEWKVLTRALPSGSELTLLLNCCPLLRIQEAGRRRFIDSAVFLFEMLEGVDQFPDARIALEGQRLEDGAHPILNPDRLRLQDFVIVISVQFADQRRL